MSERDGYSPELELQGAGHHPTSEDAATSYSLSFRQGTPPTWTIRTPSGKRKGMPWRQSRATPHQGAATQLLGRRGCASRKIWLPPQSPFRRSRRGGILEDMSGVRPRFSLETGIDAERLMQHVSDQLKRRGATLCGVVAPGRIELCVPNGRQHLWSPQLIIDIHPSATGTYLEGRYGPHPNVWTLYVAAYAALAFASFVAASFGYAQWTMEQAPVALWVLPMAVFLGLLLRFVALLGQGLGAEQMSELRGFLDDSLQAVSGAPSAPPESHVRLKKPVEAPEKRSVG